MSKPIIIDGAMGTMLQSAGMPPGARPEVFGMENPELMEEIHRKYIEAGSRVIYANTFGANARKLKGSGYTAPEVVAAGVALAVQTASAFNNAADKSSAAGAQTGGADSVRVALDIGPIGELMEPLGTLSFEDAYEIYKEMVIAGKDAGADLIVFETMTDLLEAKAGVLAAKENSDLPVWVTMSFEENGRTFTGTLLSSVAVTLSGLGVDAMGINCSLEPEKIFPLIREMRCWTDKPLIAKPNAGLPDSVTGIYSMNAEEFARQMKPFFDCGIAMAGGCCGTTPEFIRALTGLCNDMPDGEAEGTENPTPRSGVCSARQMVETGGEEPLLGACINADNAEEFGQAISDRDMDDIVELVMDEMDDEADILEMNMDLPGVDASSVMAEMVQAIQSMTALPLAIDSSDPAVIEAGVRIYSGRPIVNPLTAKGDELDAILSIAKKYGASLAKKEI